MEYSLQGKIWIWPGEAAWHFITLPTELTTELKSMIDTTKRGFSSLKVEVKIKDTRWQTSIFYDSKSNAFLLPIKKDIRKKNNLTENSTIWYSIHII